MNAELDWIYANDPVKQSGLFSHHAANQRAQRLRLMLVDIRELVDRTNNELKITGDAFYARVYRNARTKLGLGEWERQIDDKLESVQLVYQFLTDKSANTRSEFMELIVILLIAVEVILSLLRH